MSKLIFLFLLLFPPALQAQEYTGALFETHSHFEELDESADAVLSLMEDENVSAAVIFAGEMDTEEGGGVEEVRDLTDEFPDKLVPFFDCDCDDSNLTAELLQSIIDEAPGLFSGFGEQAFYSEPWSDNTPDGEPFVSLYPTLTAENLWIMIHPARDHEEELSNAAAEFPGQKFLVHGYAAREWISDLLTSFDNVYYTIDTSSLLNRTEGDEGNNLLYASDIENSDDFLAAYEENFDPMMDQAIDVFKPIIEANPDKVMWGTDISMDWHVEEEVYGKLAEFSREFISQLDGSVQDRYARTNAEGLFTPVPGTSGAGQDDDEDDASSGCSLRSSPPSFSFLIFLLFLLFHATLRWRKADN